MWGGVNASCKEATKWSPEGPQLEGEESATATGSSREMEEKWTANATMMHGVSKTESAPLGLEPWDQWR